LKHLVDLSRVLQARGVDLVMLDQGIDTSTAGGRTFFQVLGAIAVISSSSADQAPDLVLRVEDGVFDTAA
jgi:DNA invertase Pin-like site-specific DNA recombinase